MDREVRQLEERVTRSLVERNDELARRFTGRSHQGLSARTRVWRAGMPDG